MGIKCRRRNTRFRPIPIESWLRHGRGDETRGNPKHGLNSLRAEELP